ncbi:MAG: phage tail protein, partial [Clostridia bacterium]|nr:phage tail protein [Clostridia bacterium]
MATIGLDKLYYSVIEEDDSGLETYGTPKQLAKATSAELSIDLAEATLY